MEAHRTVKAEQTVALDRLSEAQLGGLRLREPAQLRQVQRSLVRYGQLEPVVVWPCGDQLELIDGFKRYHVARELGWAELRVRIAQVDSQAATVLVLELAARCALTALEQGWLVRALHRQQGLSQGAIAEQLGRHKSWVCRRLLLVEQLDASVQHDVRLGLIAARAAVSIAALPRGNQAAAAQLAVHRGLTVKQTERLVAQLSDRADPDAQHAVLSQWSAGHQAGAAAPPVAARSSAVQRLAADVAAARATCARLHARILGTALPGLQQGAARLVVEQLTELNAVLSSLRETIATAVHDHEKGAS